MYGWLKWSLAVNGLGVVWFSSAERETRLLVSL